MCGRRGDRAQFFRFVCNEKVVELDLVGNKGSRGAYCHRRIECVLNLEKKGLFERAFRLSNVQVRKEQVSELIKSVITALSSGE